MIRHAALDKNKMRNLIADIQGNIKELAILSNLTQEEFKSSKENYGLAEHYFRRSLEGILTVGTHILSRLPEKTKDYQEIIISLANQKIIPKEFAERNKKLAGYRNRLVHIYWEVSEEEMYKVIKEYLEDLDKFCQYFQKVLQNPEKFGLRIE